MKRRGELAMIQRAIREGWDITPKGRRDAVALVQEVLHDETATARERLRACSVAIQMSEENLLLEEDEALLQQVKRLGQCVVPSNP